MSNKARLSLFSTLAVLIFAVGACGGSTTSDRSSAETSPATTTNATQPAGKVSANTASESEIEATLNNAGVSNAGRWAEEVIEYRPYPTDDPNLTKLRDNLAKYNPGQETIDKIVSALTP